MVLSSGRVGAADQGDVEKNTRGVQKKPVGKGVDVTEAEQSRGIKNGGARAEDQSRDAPKKTDQPKDVSKAPKEAKKDDQEGKDGRKHAPKEVKKEAPGGAKMDAPKDAPKSVAKEVKRDGPRDVKVPKKEVSTDSKSGRDLTREVGKDGTKQPKKDPKQGKDGKKPTTEVDYIGTYPSESPKEESVTEGPVYKYQHTGKAPVELDMRLPKDWIVDERTYCDLELLVEGGLAPLTGFMTRTEYIEVCEKATLNGQPWPLPVALPVRPGASNTHWEAGETVGRGERMNLRGETGVVLCTLRVESVFARDHLYESQHTLGTTDPAHPYAAVLRDGDCVYVGGALTDVRMLRGARPDDGTPEKLHKASSGPELKLRHVTDDPYFHLHTGAPELEGGYERPRALDSARLLQRNVNGGVSSRPYDRLRVPARQVRAFLRAYEGRPVVGFQCRNPLHRSHFELTVRALATVEKETGKKPVLLLTPAAGPTQPGDVDLLTRCQCYMEVAKEYGRLGVDAHLVLVPLAMRMAGPRSAVWHALIRQNYGCTHFIVGRDHAGPSARRADGTPFYGEYDAHRAVLACAGKPGFAVSPVLGAALSYVTWGTVDPSLSPTRHPDCGYHTPEEVAELRKKHPNLVTHSISGTKLRAMLAAKEPVPSWFSFPSVAKILTLATRAPYEKGLVLYFTGLPCSGKSTLANAAACRLLEQPFETRQVTILDADIVRQHLSKGLGFSTADRSTNVRRIGYVASEVAKHRGICVVANIAPYRADRAANRALVEKGGGVYIEVHVSTPLAECERRDVKGLYRAARKGALRQFTGVDDVYELPRDAQVTLRTDEPISQAINQLMTFLHDQRLIPSLCLYNQGEQSPLSAKQAQKQIMHSNSHPNAVAI